jgi:inward rectifier potassium channel
MRKREAAREKARIVGRLLPREPRIVLQPQTAQETRVARIVPRRGDDTIVRIGLPPTVWGDLYHHTLTAPWWVVLTSASAIYLGMNALFALLYLLQPGAIDGVGDLDFEDAFFFSIQTMATIGYGKLLPLTLYANLLVTVEVLIGLLALALLTGVLFARFSRPTARVLFGRNAVIGPVNGALTLSVRTANARRNQILQAEVGLTLVKVETQTDGRVMRRFYDLALSRQRTPIFAYSFQIMHPIDEQSPLHGETVESLIAQQAEILVTVTGLDETMSQTVHARYSYNADEVLPDRRFSDMFGITQDGRIAIDYGRFHDTEPA